MLKPAIVFAGLAILFASSCNEEEDTLFDCGSLCSGLAMMNEEIVNVEINSLAYDLSPEYSTSDPTGHAQNIEQLTFRINSYCEDVDAYLVCYACIRTYPAQSEIRIELDSVGFPVTRVIDISTPEDEVLSYVGMHR